MKTENDWIKMSDQQPGDDQYPVWGALDLWGERVVSFYDRNTLPSTVTHWKRAVLPAPPAKELTQRERDDEACRGWWVEKFPNHTGQDTLRIWHAALAYRDKQNAEDLKGLVSMFSAGDPISKYARLRRRCGLAP